MELTTFLLSTYTFCFIKISVHSFKIEQVRGIEKNVKSVHFDNNFNSYVVANSNASDYFYKIDDQKTVIFKRKLTNIKTVIVNGRNNVYVFEEVPATSIGSNLYFKNEYQADQETLKREIVTDPYIAMWFMRENSKKFKKLFQWDNQIFEEFRLFIDADDYIYFSTDTGIVFLKPEENIPISHLDWEKYKFDFFKIDVNNNTYLKVTEDAKKRKESILMIPANAKKEQRYPTGKIVYSSGNDTLSEIHSIGTSSDGDVYFAVLNKTSTALATLTKFQQRDDSNTSDNQLILSQYGSSYSFLIATKNRLYFTSDVSEKYFSIYFIEKEKGEDGPNQDKIVAITELFEYPSITKDECEKDSSGNVFFVYGKKILRIKYDETETTKLTTPSNLRISSIAVDKKDNLWVLAGNLYYFKKGTENAVLVNTMTWKEKSFLKVNWNTGEIYVVSENGLQVVSS